MCEQTGMEHAPKTGELAAAARISKSYASEIVNRKRDPSWALAIHIYRQTGWRHPSIADLTAEQVDTLESIEPWRPTDTQAAA